MCRWLCSLLLLALSFAPSAVSAAESKCPLPLTECLMKYQRMRERPWLGVSVEIDSVTQERVVVDIAPGGAAERAGIRIGDVLVQIEGKPPADWFAGKAGWKDGDELPVAVRRAESARTLRLRAQGISEELLAKYVGVHMLEGHLAYMHDDHADGEHQH